MALDNANELPNWSATVRKVDSTLHAAFARQEREAARKQAFWKRPSKTSTAVAPSAASDLSQPIAGAGY
jgi:hypothetical protein